MGSLWPFMVDKNHDLPGKNRVMFHENCLMFTRGYIKTLYFKGETIGQLSSHQFLKIGFVSAMFDLVLD